MVDVKKGQRYIGKLKAFDIHINVVLQDAEEQIDGKIARKLGTVFIRGDGITTITPSEG